MEEREIIKAGVFDAIAATRGMMCDHRLSTAEQRAEVERTLAFLGALLRITVFTNASESVR